MNKNVIQALPLIASALGRKFGVKVEIGGERAFTDGKSIHIPALPLESDENTLNLARGYLDHEAAHLRVTDFDLVKKSHLTGIERHVWNILEDFMVERKLAAIYPGCGENFNWLAKHLFLGTANESSPAQALFNCLLLSVRSFAVPELAREKAALEGLINTAYPALLAELEPLVKGIFHKCQDTRSCISMAKAIVDCIQNYVDKHPEPEQAQNPSYTEDNKEVQKENKSNPICSGNSDENHQKSETSAKSDNPADSSENTQSDNAQTNENGETQDTGCASATLKDVLENANGIKVSDMGVLAGQMLETIGKTCAGSQLEVAIPRKSVNQPFSPSDIAGIRQKTSALRTRLTALLQSKVLCRIHPGRSGRIDPKWVSNLAVSDPKVFSRRNEKHGMNTAAPILLDATGSMSNGKKIALACHACYAVSEALYKIPGISVAVTSFPNGASHDSEHGLSCWNTVCPVLEPNQKFHSNFQVKANGSRPMASSLWWVLQQMQLLSEKRKILLILSDGEPDNLQETLKALDAHRACGHEIYGIGIATNAIKALVARDKSRAIFDLEELAQTMFEMLKNVMVKGE